MINGGNSMERHFPLYLTDTELEEIQDCFADRLDNLKEEQKKKDLTKDQSANLFSVQAVIETIQEKVSMLREYVRKGIEANNAKREAEKARIAYERFATGKVSGK